MNEMLSITLSLVSLIISLLAWIISFLESRKQNHICCNLQSSIKITIKNRTHIDSDMPEILKYVDDILHSLYPKAKFQISIKVLVKNDGLSDSFVKTFITYYNNHTSYSESALTPVKESFDLNAILYNKKRFFFVSDIEEYGKFNASDFGPYSFTPNSSVIVFPIKKEHPLNSESIIGFLCLSSPEKLDNPKKNEILMKQLARISSKLYLPLQAAVPQLYDS